MIVAEEEDVAETEAAAVTALMVIDAVVVTVAALRSINGCVLTVSKLQSESESDPETDAGEPIVGDW